MISRSGISEQSFDLVDTHCHLDFDAFDDDRTDVIHRAGKAGIGYLLNPGIDLETSRIAVELSEMYPAVFAAVGVHPNSALVWEDNTLARLRELAAHPKVVAIGEIGLDYYERKEYAYDRAPREVQVHVFKQQLNLASELGLPVVIHSRRAETEIVDVLTEWVSHLDTSASSLGERPGVLHSYQGDEESAQRAISLNFSIGITGPVTFRNAAHLQHLVAALPLESLLIETDAPFLTPHPYRGQRNEPAFVRFVAAKIAELKNQPIDIVAHITTANARRLFSWSKTA
jgi:TatD DNase family protein